MTATISPERTAAVLLVAVVSALLALALLAPLSPSGAEGPALGKGGFQWTPPPVRQV